MGTEGVGRVVAVGSDVKHLKEGDRTLIPFLCPAWAERVKTDAPWLRPLPSGDVNQFAMMGVNPPTAYLLLTDMVTLPRGSWIIQNAANSGVGRAAIAIAKLLELKTINIVRRQQAVYEIKALGGEVVLVDGSELAKQVAAETGNAPVMLALDGVGGASTMNLMSTLFEGALLVSYGGMSRQPMAVQPGSLIFKKQTLRGFWLLDWYQSAEPEAIKAMFDYLVTIITAGKISTPVVASYDLDQFREAISKAAESGGKVLFTPNSTIRKKTGHDA